MDKDQIIDNWYEELIQHSYDNTIPIFTVNDAVWQYKDFDMEQFARLIINECRVVVTENFHECNTATKMDRIIRDEFGIE